MSLSSPFIHRPVATTLLTIALGLAGAIAYKFLPVSPLPQVDFPSISVGAGLPGADPETMASAVATPLERQFSRIAGVTEMTSTSTLGSTSITLVFDLNRNIDAAARDVQAAINAARGQLPANLPGNPSYRKVNPADAPVMILALTSHVYDKPRMYDAASTILQQKLAQVPGVGQVVVGGGALPGVRVDVNPTLLNNLGLSLADVRTALGAANVNRPKGEVADDRRTLALAASDQLLTAAAYRPLILAFRNGAPVRLSDVADVSDGVEDVRTAGYLAERDANGEVKLKPAILLVIFRQPGANIIDTVDKIRALMPQLQAEIPAAMRLRVAMDRTLTIRASVADVMRTLGISIVLVILVVFVFLRDLRATLIPSVAVPVSLVGTFGVMYLCGYNVDNLSLMAMTIATGFVVDDAIVVVENISRHMEHGMRPMQAALLGAKEIGFTVLSISVSLIAVFIPILLMTGYIGRLFREFAVTLSVAIALSMIISLTTTPMMCARLLKHRDPRRRGRLYRLSERFFDGILWIYEVTLRAVLRHPLVTLMVTLGTIVFTVYLYVAIPKDLFPTQDTGRMSGMIRADQDTSFQRMDELLQSYARIVAEDPAIDNVLAFSGGGRGSTNVGNMFVALTPLEQRKVGVLDVMGRIRGKAARIPGASLIFNPMQDLRIGGRVGAGTYQYSLQGDDLQELSDWGPRMLRTMRGLKGITDCDSDQQNRGLQAYLDTDRATAARLGITQQMVDDALYDHFGQRQVSTMYTQLNQYHVVMEAAPWLLQHPNALEHVYVKSPVTGQQVPLSTVTHYVTNNTALAVNHSGLFPSITISFNLLPGFALGDAVTEVQQAARDQGMPGSIHGSFAGTAQAYQATLATQPLLIAAALVAVYIVLGILYESLVHPVTIISTLPSAGVGALLALMLTGTPFTVIALIGIILLIGIVKKNAIMMIDFALDAERREGKSPRQAIFQACLLRFRPITMTTMAALLGGLPLAMGSGTGSELRRPLGIAIVGGLIFSQLLTLYTTPVVYLYLDRLRLFLQGHRSEEARRSADQLAAIRQAEIVGISNE